MSTQEPNAPTPAPNASPDPKPAGEAPPSKSPLGVRLAIGAGVVGLCGVLLWSLVGEELYDQVQEYREAVLDSDLAAPVGYLGLNYRKEYNARAPQFVFEEEDGTRLWASIGDGETPEFYDVTEAQFDPTILQGGFGRDSIPGIDYPIIRPPDGEIARNIGARNEVIGVVLSTGARAYPMGVLTKVEVINDVDGDVPIAIVYARGPDTVRIYRRDVDGRPITLGTTGYATDRKVPLFYDRRTKGLWLQDSDEGALTCVSGEYVGTQLPEHATPQLLTWRDWRRQQPGTDVVIGNDRAEPIPVE